MRKKILLIVVAVSFLMLHSDILIGQQGVLLPKKITAQDEDPQITPRRGQETNPNFPDFTQRHYIAGPNDVNVIFGAGESSLIVQDSVYWPALNYQKPLIYAVSRPSVLLGSNWAKNAVIAIADRKGLVTGDLYDIRIYNGSNSNGAYGTNTYNGPANTPDGTIYTTLLDPPAYDYVTVTTSQVATTAAGRERYRFYLPNKTDLAWSQSTDIIYQANLVRAGLSLPLFTSASDGWDAISDLLGIGTTGADPALEDITNGYIKVGYANAGAIYYPYRMIDPASSIYEPTIGYNYYVLSYWHLDPWRLDYRTFSYDGEEANALYTSTRVPSGTSWVDDGQPLLITNPIELPDRDAFQTDIDNASYVRPTTLLIQDINTFDSIAVSDVEWYVARMWGRFVSPTYRYQGLMANSCAHFNGVFTYLRDDNAFQIDYPGSERYVDAAVRILDKSEVCVIGNVTSAHVVESDRFSLGSPPDEVTSALLVLPGKDDPQGRRSNFSLKIGGNADILHSQDSGAFVISPSSDPLIDGYLYSNGGSAAGPGPDYPRAQVPIWLGSGQNPIPFVDEVTGLKYDYVHPRGFTLTDNTAADTEWIPFRSTYGSVYGVYGDYNGKTDIHTKSIAGFDTTSVILIGPETANQSYFNIYSMGMLKNFRSNCVEICDSMMIGVMNNAYGKNDGGSGIAATIEAPHFEITNSNKTLYILNDGTGVVTAGEPDYCEDAGIIFTEVGVDSINSAIAIENANGGGDLHIQAQSFIKFYNADTLKFDVSKYDNNIKILSDSGFIYVAEDLKFVNNDTANFTMWARGEHDDLRGFTDLTRGGTGAIQIGSVKISLFNKGLALLRSEYDDVLVLRDFTFNSGQSSSQDESGELMVQAGQDIRIGGKTTINKDGEHAVLFEAQKSIYFGDDLEINLGTDVDHGHISFVAGYPFFHDNADVDEMENWKLSNDCYPGSYLHRDEEQDVDNTGGDIWFGGDVIINSTTNTPLDDMMDTYVRAYNSVHIDGDFIFNVHSATHYSIGDTDVDTVMKFAELGNIEAFAVVGNEVRYWISDNDSVYFLFQAGNVLGKPCWPSLPCLTSLFDRWHGNILFGTNKTFTINHDGVGPTRISAARDIENQVGAAFTFNYTNDELKDDDILLITAGRHIETHAPYAFNYFNASGPLHNITNNITMEAGHQDQCLFQLCKEVETPSNIAFNRPPVQETPPRQNEFADGGNGNGSILLFSSVTFNYEGQGDILMTARNGNIESDPYLHGTYKGGAPIIFNHYNSPGIVTMEAIDIKLHDILRYNTDQQSHNILNGNFSMLAFDSILTRNIRYENLYDEGSVLITTYKLKRTIFPDCDGSIHQGHIVLGYGADCGNENYNDTILFDFSKNPALTGANLDIIAGERGFTSNTVNGKANANLFGFNRPEDRGKGYGGNITFDFMKINMGVGNGDAAGSTVIRTPNGNIWGKDSLQFHAVNGNLTIDAGLGSLEDTLRAIRWSGFNNGNEDMLNTSVPLWCGNAYEWRTGNIMLKGGSIDFSDDVTSSTDPGKGNATIRTREGYIDIYDRFNATNMSGHLLIYAGLDAPNSKANQWGDVSLRDFQYTPVVNSGSVYIGADDNIMLNYGYNNGNEPAYNWRWADPHVYDVTQGLVKTGNPFYTNGYGIPIPNCYATFNVNTNGYLWYRNQNLQHTYHVLYRGCQSIVSDQNSTCSPSTGECRTLDNGARPLTFDFEKTASGATINSGGLAVVATNFIDVFTEFTYVGGSGSGLANRTLRGQNVNGYGLYMKSTFDGPTRAENRRQTCYECDDPENFDWPYIAFHDDVFIYPQNQKALIEAPVVEFFGNTDIDLEQMKGTLTSMTMKSDSLIFHDSVIFDGTNLKFEPYTTNPALRKLHAMRLGVVNDLDGKYYREFGEAIVMNDRMLPVIELGFQRCLMPPYTLNLAPNSLSERGGEPTPQVGGDIIVAFKHDAQMPVFNTVVANHARISFVSDMVDGVKGAPWGHSYFRTDLLRIRNKVEFYTDPDDTKGRTGYFEMTTNQQMPTAYQSGMFPRHVHLEPGSELSIPGENNLLVIAGTTLGGYGEAHENVHVQAHGILAPGYASLMEWDCTSGRGQGSFKIHNLAMEQDAILRISMSNNNCVLNPETNRKDLNCAQADTLIVQDSVFFWGKIKLQVLAEDEYIEPGCYLFMIYNETNVGPEYLHNLELVDTRIAGNYYYIDYVSEPGRVYLCVSETPAPYVQRYVNIHAIEGVTTNPIAGIYHYVKGHEDFVFTATYKDNEPFEVFAVGYYSKNKQVLAPTYKYEGTYEYTIRQVVEPWDIYFDPEQRGDGTGNVAVLGEKVWAFRNTLFVNVDNDDVVSVYNMTGVLFKKIEITSGLNKLTLDKGVYLVKLNDGSAYRIIIN